MPSEHVEDDSERVGIDAKQLGVEPERADIDVEDSTDVRYAQGIEGEPTSLYGA